MTLIAFEIPESPQEIASWLETIICAGDLRKLVAQLSAVHGDADASGKDALSLHQWMGADRALLLDQGLRELEEQKLQRLLTHPSLLLDLQELVMSEGGAHWTAQFKSAGGQAEVDEVVAATRSQIEEEIGLESRVPPTPISSTTNRTILAIAVLAACLLLGAFGVSQFMPDSTEQPQVAKWGWASEDAIPSDLSSQEYLSALENGAQAWFKKRPQDSAALKKRLVEYRLGCETLLSMQHRPLSDEDRDWLLEKCRKWKTRIETQIAAVENADFAEALKAADQVASDMAAAIKARAAEIRS